MLIILSPAKTLDFTSPSRINSHSQPDFLDDAQILVEELRRLSPARLSNLMGLSVNLGDLNFQRFLSWQRPFKPDNAKQAVFAFKGPAYTSLDAASLSSADLQWAQNHLRLLSGLYGLLRPLDLIQPYRLEMGTKLANCRGDNLYQFWDYKITDTLNRLLAKQKPPVFVNLASQEYYKVLQPLEIKGEIITPVFKDWSNNRYKTLSLYAKQARGLMSRFIIQNRIIDAEALKDFSENGYRYNPSISSAREWVFLRR